MHILEGRGQGATWALLKEALHNQGVYVTTAAHVDIVKQQTLLDMVKEEEISLDGLEYLRENVFSIDEYSEKGRQNDSKVPLYVDLAMSHMHSMFSERLGQMPNAIALGNEDNQIVKPKHLKEMNNTFVLAQREAFGRV